MDLQQVIDLINQYGFPIVAAVGMGYFVFFIYKYVTDTLSPIIKETNLTLISLIDRIRMLDNDLIRLQQKVNVTLQLKQDMKREQENETKD